MSGVPVLRYEVDHEGDISQLVYTFGGVDARGSIAPGSVLDTSSLDCFAGKVRSVHDHVSEVCDPRFLNPQTGPFYVEGAMPGDVLAVHFARIEPRDTLGFSTTVPLFGALTANGFTQMLHQPLPEMTWAYAIDAEQRTVRYEARESEALYTLPLDPMHGTVGVAPALNEARSALTPGDWGGNMDTPEMRSGVTCYLGVNVEGALFSFGDGHARQGEGETCGVAVETAMDTVMVIDLIKDATPVLWPRLESDTEIITTGSTKPLEDAFRISQVQMVQWVAELTGLSIMDSYQFVSQTSLAPIANVVDTNYTVVAKIRKDQLPGANPMNGIHSRLRDMGRAYLATR
ncbi:MAG TPA: acetamidase/formamidase family protein [Acidimicrobiales bacterium]|jgi:acetamidase/formamidase|nr:acetamidase/formamidase family protein [Acidimicrobiales bacterium]